MRKPWWHRWRWLIALLVGVGAWWGVGLWLSFRPIYTLRFPKHSTDDEWCRSQGGFKNYEEISGLAVFKIRSFDADGRYYILEVPIDEGRGKYRYEVRNTRTGEIVFTHDCVNSQQSDIIVRAFQARRDFATDGSIHIVESGNTGQQVWRINVLTGEQRQLGVFPHSDNIVLSKNGSTSVTIEDVPSLDFLTLAPLPTLPSALLLAVARVEGQHKPSDSNQQFLYMRRLRVWSLPELSEQFSTWLAPVYTFRGFTFGEDFQLAQDGSWFTYADETFQCRQELNRRNTQTNTTKGAINLFNCQTGVTARIPLPTGIVARGLAYAPDGFIGVSYFAGHSRSRKRSGFSNGMETIYYHFASQKWFAKPEDMVGGLSDFGGNSIRYFCDEPSQKRPILHVFESHADGNAMKKATLPINSFSHETHRFIPDRPWIVIADCNPYWSLSVSSSWEEKAPYLNNLWSSPVGTTIYDYSTGRALWHTTHDDNFGNVVITPNYVIETHRQNGHHIVNVLALRDGAYSPWWSRLAGLLAAVLAWGLLRIKRLPVSKPPHHSLAWVP